MKIHMSEVKGAFCVYDKESGKPVVGGLVKEGENPYKAAVANVDETIARLQEVRQQLLEKNELEAGKTGKPKS